MWWVVVSLVLSWSSQSSAVDDSVHVSCKDENNRDVDWYIMYKASRSNLLTGVEYVYIDPSGKRVMPPPPPKPEPGPGPRPSPPPYKPISDSDGVLAHTLRPMLSSARYMPSSFGFLSYSDQPPGSNANMNLFGHSKGVVLGDSGTGTALWLTHSTPQFPFRRDQNNFWPPSGNEHGQTFMCVTLPFSALKTVGEHLQNIRAFPYDHDLTIDFPRELRDAANWVTSESLLGKFQILKTTGNKDLKIMAKPLHYTAEAGDLYVKLAADLDSDVDAQTWGCQPGRDKSFCDTDKRHVMNVEVIHTDLGEWSTKRDHSKWAVTTKKNIAWTCFGDVNRAVSQYQRWGGAVCIHDNNVNGFFKVFAKGKLSCRKRPAPCSSSELDSEMELPSEIESIAKKIWNLVEDNLKEMLKYIQN